MTEQQKGEAWLARMRVEIGRRVDASNIYLAMQTCDQRGVRIILSEGDVTEWVETTKWNCTEHSLLAECVRLLSEYHGRRLK